MPRLSLLSASSRSTVCIAASIIALLLIFLTSSSAPPALKDKLNQVGHAGIEDSYKVSSVRRRALEPILNSTLGFEKVVAINLPERTDHRDGLVLAGAVSDIDITFLDGVRGDNVPENALPPAVDPGFTSKHIGSWRAHVNAISAIVEHGWGSALILEDDIHWDVLLKQQLQQFALASDAYLRTSGGQTVDFEDLDTSHIPETSPYGDGWDILWFGHCGMELPEDAPIILIHNDTTAVPLKHQRTWDSEAEPVMRVYPEYTRAISDARTMVCTLAYAVSQQAARRLLQEIGLKRLDHPFDVLLAKWCDGIGGFDKHKCITVMPQIIDHFYTSSPNIRWSIRMNMDKVLNGETEYEEYFDG